MASITPEYASVLRNVWVNCTASTHGLLFRDLGLDFDHSLGGLHTRYDAKEMFGMLWIADEHAANLVYRAQSQTENCNEKELK